MRPLGVGRPHNGLGRYAEALAGGPGSERRYTRVVRLGVGADRADRSGGSKRQRKLAADAVDRLAGRSHASGTDWGLGIEARARALVSEGETAEPLYRDAIERLGRTGFVPSSAARTCSTASGCAARAAGSTRARRLRTAHDMFVAIGMEAFAERARRELEATGETVRKRTVEARDELTAQERQIARLARDGLSNPEIGARLFLSPRTVEYHLRKVYETRHQLPPPARARAAPQPQRRATGMTGQQEPAGRSMRGPVSRPETRDRHWELLTRPCAQPSDTGQHVAASRTVRLFGRHWPGRDRSQGARDRRRA